MPRILGNSHIEPRMRKGIGSLREASRGQKEEEPTPELISEAVNMRTSLKQRR